MLETAGSRVGRHILWSERIDPTGTGTIAFTGIPGTGSMLEIFGMGRATTAGTASENILARFNGDAGANYDYQQQHTNKTTAFAGQTLGSTSVRIAEIMRAGALANYGDVFRVLIPFYANATFYKGFLSHYMIINPGNLMSNHFDITAAGRWAGRAPISQVDLILDAGLWVPGSQVAAYVY